MIEIGPMTHTPPITPESRARAIVTAWDEGDYAGKSCGELDAIIEQDIAQAIRGAENAAYERAAQVAENDRAKCQANAFTLRHVSEARHDLWLACADTGLKIADAILSLRHKDTL